MAAYTPSQGTRTTALNRLFFAFGKTKPVSLPVLKPSLGAIQAFPTPEYPEKGYTLPWPGLGQKVAEVPDILSVGVSWGRSRTFAAQIPG
jgi:hypothetical protein